MQRLKVVRLVLLAAFAVSIVSVASASAALPEFTGPFPKTFTSTSGKGALETVGGKTVTCTSDTTDEGKITGEKTATAVVLFSGCKSGIVSCNSPGQAAGVIDTVPLTGTLGYISKAEKRVGLLLVPTTGELFVEFECTGFAKSKVKGAVIGELTPVNKKTKTFTLAFKQTKGKQAITKFEGGATEILESSLNGGAFEQAGEETTDTLTLTEEGEIKA
jgi:hypothetical protein